MLNQLLLESEAAELSAWLTREREHLPVSDIDEATLAEIEAVSATIYSCDCERARELSDDLLEVVLRIARFGISELFEGITDGVLADGQDDQTLNRLNGVGLDQGSATVSRHE